MKRLTSTCRCSVSTRLCVPLLSSTTTIPCPPSLSCQISILPILAVVQKANIYATDDDMDVEPTPRLGEMEVDEDGNDFEMVDGEVDVVASEDETDMVAVEADASAAEADAKDVAVTRAVVTDVEMAGARSDIPGGPAPETAEHSEMGGGTH